METTGKIGSSQLEAQPVSPSHDVQRTVDALLVCTASSPRTDGKSYLHTSDHINVWNLRG